MQLMSAVPALIVHTALVEILFIVRRYHAAASRFFKVMCNALAHLVLKW